MAMSDIQIKMFGCFDILYKGKTIFLEINSSVKAISILRFLLIHKDKIFTSEAIAESLWPDNEYSDSVKVIRTYIHRLRKIINSENSCKKDFSDVIHIVNIKGGYKCELIGEYEMDTEIFSDLKDKIENEKNPDEFFMLYNQLYLLYGGEFLEDCRYDQWVMTFRNNYVRSFSAVSAGLLDKLCAEGLYAKALDVCEKSLKLSPLDENLNIYYLTALLETEQSAAAYSHYNYISNRLYQEQSIIPSDKLRSLYSRIKNEKNKVDSTDNLPNETVDKRMLFNMINDVVKTYMTSDKTKFSVATVKIFEKSSEEIGEANKKKIDELRTSFSQSEMRKVLKYSLEYALRKNDMYSIIDEYNAIIILYDAKEEFFINIVNRVTSAFYEKYTGSFHKIKVNIFPVVTID